MGGIVSDMTMRKCEDKYTDKEDEALERFMSTHGATRSIDELIDEILNGKDSKTKRRFSTW